VILPRATQIPEIPPDGNDREDPDEVPPEGPQDDALTEPESDGESDRVPDEQLIEAVLSKLPAGLIDDLTQGARISHRGQRAGKSGATQKKGKRGRAYGARAGRIEDGARVNLAETLIAAAPWQKVRASAASGSRGSGLAKREDDPLREGSGRRRIDIRPSDIRLYRHREKSETVAVFVVDASGSAAAMRLAEAKGAIERLLAENYARRDQVALIAMQGREASLLMAPTRSLVRAKRQLALLPGGGGTPLAHGLDQARLLCEQIARRGQMPVVVVLTDGQANIARNGEPGRAAAEHDALSAARALAFDGVRCLVIDVAYRKQRKVEALAAAMQGTYLLLPQSGGATVSEAVRSVFE